MSKIDEEIRSKTEAFARDLAVLVRRAALEAAAIALGGDTPAAAPLKVAAKRGRGRPRKTAAPAAPAPIAKAPAAKPTKAPPALAAKPAPAAPVAKAPASKRAAAPERAAGAKRPPGELVKLTEKLAAYIKANPGRRMEAIGRALGVATKELNLPVKKLLAAKTIRSEGKKRATEYFAA